MHTKRITLAAAAFAAFAVLGALAIDTGAALAADPIKQSRSGICHCPGGDGYEATTRFTAFDTIEACLEADGRHPKRGQGECSPPVASIGDATTQAILDLRASLEGLSLRVAMLEAAAIEASAEEEKAPTYTRAQAYNVCVSALNEASTWRSDREEWCLAVPVEHTDDYVECFAAQRANGAWSDDAHSWCKQLIGF